jgi:hypothetical protein
VTTPPASSAIKRADAGGLFGLLPAADFRITTGAAAAGFVLRQAGWYFRDETIAIPTDGMQRAGFTPGMRALDDVRAWAARRTSDARQPYPTLVWVAAPDRVRNAQIDRDANALTTADGALALRLVPKIAMNRSYWDGASAAFFAQRRVAMRGTLAEGCFVARTLWPEDFRVGPQAPPSRPLPDAPSPALALRALMRAVPHGGARSSFAAATLWQRDPALAAWAGRPVLAFVVNGAQGDDDEAHGGHFAVATGRIADDGAIGDWLVDNFYSLDVESEKGILAAPVPLDNYQGDLNCGQSWYRPSYLLVAVLRDARAAELVQAAIDRVYLQFYRHQVVYYHPCENCTSISVDTLAALGLTIRPRGPASLLRPWLGFPIVAVREHSIAKARLAFDYLRVDATRLLPAAALEETFATLWRLVHGGTDDRDGPLATNLAQDIDALAFAHIPQFPSSRAWGDAPVATTDEYEARMPKDPALAQIIPLPSRPFPDDLRDPDLLPRSHRPSDTAARLWGATAAAASLLVAWALGKLFAGK